MRLGVENKSKRLRVAKREGSSEEARGIRAQTGLAEMGLGSRALYGTRRSTREQQEAVKAVGNSKEYE